MRCFIYKSLKKEELYLYLGKPDDFSAIPHDLLANLGQLVYVMELELNAERKLAREDVNKVMNNIRTKGFFVQLPPAYIPFSITSANKSLH